MQNKQIKTNTSQNLRQKLGLKDSLTNINQIYSQPHSSKGAETRKKENVQDCNTMKKKLFNMLGQNYNSNKAFSISPTNSLKQNYFVSTSTQQNSKQLLQKQNNTLDCHTSVAQNLFGNSAKNVQSQPSLNQFEKYTSFLENQNFENRNPPINPAKKVGIAKPNSTQSRNHKTDRSSLIALFEKLHEKECHNKHRKQTSQNSNYVVNNQKQQPQECFYTELKFRQKMKGSLSNNSSGQLCSHLNPNSSSTQIQQNQQNSIDDNLQQLAERMQYILNSYHQKLKQVDFEKEVLIQEIQYWKSKYQKCQQKSSIS
ncbi:unnamed protein product (macronuclear) [Paramecium tetraurelia]|uniref:Uncharacterized protein n=1 Tax=Paramecium tetraurelia TaxID=5888 RepID=A0BIS1_PARTE|nr:uncharacterized protein GSPATT00004810001 [Paramecium tetraurelia]CAK58438.1 unnamed protein product [Paramecium tetraurelia]|eukprot:XP_001425836.1 hypothetical protein (macronuclear) [Paramecium tetraurelia strain d4-2]